MSRYIYRKIDPDCRTNATTKSHIQYMILNSYDSKTGLYLCTVNHSKNLQSHHSSHALPNSLNHVSRVPAPANAAQIVLDATEVKQRVDVVHPRPRSSPLVSHRVRNPVLLPPQPRQWVVPLHTPSHVPPRVSGSSHLSVGMPQCVHS
ncbi:hypothetical protein M758_8G072500 [Ceratodon purpureus]|nr:hypothetical protein M758_8G072500 [Ceratodon purpureus]